MRVAAAITAFYYRSNENVTCVFLTELHKVVFQRFPLVGKEFLMFRRLSAALLITSLSVAPAMAYAAKPIWNSATFFVGQTKNPKTGYPALTYYPAIVSTIADNAGNYETWVQYKPYYQESYAIKKAVAERAACIKTNDNSCVNGQPFWHEQTSPTPFLPPMQ
jgi:hypothetical protein